MLKSALTQTSYTIRRQVFKLLGGAFHVYDSAGQVVGYAKLKAFKLKEDLRLYTNDSMQTELLVIQARQIVDFSAAYDVFDPAAGIKVGALRRRGLKSLIRDEWLILDPSDNEVGLIQEDRAVLALIRRFIEAAAMFLPQKYSVSIQGQSVGIFKQNINPFVYKLNVDLSEDPSGLLDRRMAIAAAILMAAIEGKQQ